MGMKLRVSIKCQARNRCKDHQRVRLVFDQTIGHVADLQPSFTVSVFMLNFRRQAPHQYGKGLLDGTGRTRSVNPHIGQ